MDCEMALYERTLAVLEAFYDAALDETLWPSALEQLTEATGSQSASFWVLDGSEAPRLSSFITFNFDPTPIKEYLEHAAAIDPTVRYLAAHPEIPIVHDGLVIGEAEKAKHPYYAWHNSRLETRFRMVGQAQLMPSVQAGVALHRTPQAGRYERADIDHFAVIHHHLQRALKIGVRIGSLAAGERFGKEWLDRSASAVFLLDDRKHIVFCNEAASALQAKGDGVRFSAHRIALARKDDETQLQALIDRALARTGARQGGIMRAQRASGKRPFSIFVTPLGREYPTLAMFRPAVCVAITDPEVRPVLPIQRLQAAFDLTEAEARLAVLLSQGEDLKRAAQQLNITYGTARARLTQIFEKTDTRRQADLVSLMLKTFALG
jgi:DNA-binding CsgD family transcriptional regulator